MGGVAGIGGDDGDPLAAQERIELLAKAGLEERHFVEQDETPALAHILGHRSRAPLVVDVVAKVVRLWVELVVEEQPALATAGGLFPVDAVERGHHQLVCRPARLDGAGGSPSPGS
jgi:hypothetical protein